MRRSESLRRQSGAGERRRASSLLAWWRRNRRRLREEDGGSLTEFALSISTALTLVFVLIQLCLALYSYGMISETAREATRWAIVRGSTCVTGAGASCTTSISAIKTYAQGLGFPNLGSGTLSATPTFPQSCETPDTCTVKVVVTYTVPINLPFVPHNAVIMQSTSIMYFLQ
jgi:Flp pilus assembly protein TadG